MLRVGLGHDTHQLTDGTSVVLGGVWIEHTKRLKGHSDADVLLHALTDALLGAAGLGDIGELFPDTDPNNRNRDSAEMLQIAWRRVRQHHWQIVNLDFVLFAEKPKIAPYKEAMRKRIAELLGIDMTQIGIKAKTGEAIGIIGREEAISAECVVLLQQSENRPVRYPLFDRTKLKLKPLHERVHDISIDCFIGLDEALEPFDHPALMSLAGDILSAQKKDAAIMLMYGAHVIRTGCALHMIEMMKRGQLTHLATNGAGSIHDFEFALIGETCESVERYVGEGQFGLWHETGKINTIIAEGCKEGLGWGEALGRYIWENRLPYREKSVLAMGYHLGIPCTVHVGIGSDIIHEHPNCDGGALGRASYTDFLIYTQTVTKLEGGVFLNFGSAVTGPEVYLKALAMARNVARQSGEQIAHFTTAVFDVQPLGNEDHGSAPPKSNPRYFFRPWKTILARTVADGGKSYYVQGEHRLTLPHMARRVWEMEKQS